MKDHIKRAIRIFRLGASLYAAPLAVSASSDDEVGLKSALKATTLQGMTLQDRSGDAVGSVDEIVLDTVSSRIDAIVVNTGLLGIGGVAREIRIDQLKSPELSPYVIKVNLSLSDIKRAPVFSAPELRSTGEREGNLRAGKLLALDALNAVVEDHTGTPRGEVHDWVVDLKGGYVPYLIVRAPDPMPLAQSRTGYQYFALSADRVLGMRGGNVVASISPEELIDADRIDDSTPLMRSGDDPGVYDFEYEAEAALGLAH